MNVAILGLGTVGRGVYELLQEQSQIHVEAILERNPACTTDVTHLLVDSLDDILTNPSIDVVIELIGGTTFAYDCIRQSLLHKKHVVTANKAVISAHFEELQELAQQVNRHLLYEASVGGAIIVLDPLKQIAKINKLSKIQGIVNGATNYVLTRIYLDDLHMEDAIQEAFAKGYLETGTTDDMDGLDAMRKINILSMLGYQTILPESAVIRVPLSAINADFHHEIKERGHVLKYVARSIRQGAEVQIQIMPVVMSTLGQFSNITYEWNSIELYGSYHERQTFIGQGAGRYPTATAVVYDLFSILDDTARASLHASSLTVNPDLTTARYLVQTTKGFLLTEPLTYTQLLEMNDIIAFAQWEVEV